MKRKNFYQQGIAIVTSILLVGVILAIVFALSAVFIPKIHNAGETKNSVGAAYAAETGLEWCLYENRIGPTTSPKMDLPGATFSVNPADCSTSPIRAVGAYRGVTRAFEITF